MASDTLDSTSTTILRVGILIVSTSAFGGTTTDLTTDLLRKSFTQENESTPPASTQWQVAATKIVPDDPGQIQASILAWTDASADINLIVTSGGTGFTENDKTPEAVSQILERQASGLVHAMLSSSLSITPFAAMSRPVAGTRKSTVIITLPGSPKGAVENLTAIIRILPNACIQTAGLQPSRKLHAGGV